MDPGGAADLIADFLSANKECNVVIGTGQADTEGAGLAIEKSGAHSDYFIAGFDLSPEIMRMLKEGVIFCTVDQQPYIQGFYPVMQLSQFCRFGIKPMNIDSGAAIITRENIRAKPELSEQNYR